MQAAGIDDLPSPALNMRTSLRLPGRPEHAIVFLEACDRRSWATRGKEATMKIELEGSLLKMTPESDREREELNQLWNIIIDCVNENRKLVPVGEYLPGMKEVATFNIE